MIYSTKNGGLISYFYNSGADTLTDCLEDLKVLEATEVLAQVKRVCGLFPAGVPTDLDARNEVINSWPDGDDAIEALLQDVDDALMPLMKDLERRLDEHLRRNGLT